MKLILHWNTRYKRAVWTGSSDACWNTKQLDFKAGGGNATNSGKCFLTTDRIRVKVHSKEKKTRTMMVL